MKLHKDKYAFLNIINLIHEISTCGTCKYGEEWDGIEIISCTIDMQLHNESDTCDSHKAAWWAGGK